MHGVGTDCTQRVEAVAEQQKRRRDTNRMKEEILFSFEQLKSGLGISQVKDRCSLGSLGWVEALFL